MLIQHRHPQTLLNRESIQHTTGMRIKVDYQCPTRALLNRIIGYRRHPHRHPIMLLDRVYSLICPQIPS